MATKKLKRAPRPTRSTLRGQAPKEPGSILFVFGDGQKLRTDGLALEAPTVMALAATLLRGARAELIEGTTDVELRGQVRTQVSRKTARDVVVVVAHGNSNGVRLASDAFYDWEHFADLLRPLKPRKLVLVTCDGGRWPAADLLFQRLPLLRRIFASPTKASRDLGGLMVLLAPYLLANKAPSNREVLGLQLASQAFGAGQLRQWVRTRDAGNSAGIAYDLLSQLWEQTLRP